MTLSDLQDETTLVSHRACDGCTMCCKLLSIDVLEKPRAVWCTHCDTKRGCEIYEDRPVACRTFHCAWRRMAELDERWKPSKCKFLVNYEAAHRRIAIHVDPGCTGAWRAEPFYSTIKAWTKEAEARGGSVVVWTGKNVTVVSQHGDFDLGALRDDQYILPVNRKGPSGLERAYIAVEPDDPRLM